MGLVLGITVAVLTLPVGEALAIFIIVSHYHPIHLSW